MYIIHYTYKDQIININITNKIMSGLTCQKGCQNILTMLLLNSR